MLQFSGKWGRFGAREAIAKAWRKVKPGRRSGSCPLEFGGVINRALQAFAREAESAYIGAIMPDDRIASAYDRIEAALGRIERSARAQSVAHPPERTPETDPDLAARHAILRETVSASLAELDRLIERLEP
jgi:hypothetical protein